MCRALLGRVGYYGWKGEKSWFDAFFGRLGMGMGGGGGVGCTLGGLYSKNVRT